MWKENKSEDYSEKKIFPRTIPNINSYLNLNRGNTSESRIFDDKAY